MVSSKQQPIYDIRETTVFPGLISGNGAFHELSAMDLAMKLHYIQFVYYFRSPAFDGLAISDIKETMYHWLNHAYIPCGRLRRTDSGRLSIKCNDSGVRVIEARCHLSLTEWLESSDDSSHNLLVPNHVIGPDLIFSPLVKIQLTKFTCGATSIGLSWSHLLGDATSATSFMNLWAQVIAGHHPAQPLTMAQTQTHTCDTESPKLSHYMLPMKRVGPIGDIWSTSSNFKMETFSFYISMSKLTELQVKIHKKKSGPQIPLFESICVVIWNCLGKIRHGLGLEVVTVCKSNTRNQTKGIITNKRQTICVVKTDVSKAECNLMRLGSLMMTQAIDERIRIGEVMENDDKLQDFLIYGANLTFVDLSDASFYDMEVRGQKPVYISCFIDNIDDKGVVLVLPTPKGCSDGRIVTITLPKNEVIELKTVLKEDWCLA